jgi:hypothetical protein
MKKAALVLLLGLCLGTAAFTGFYYLGTSRAREMLKESEPELAWLKHEFNLSDAEYTRVNALHEAYLPRCAERCRLIEAQNACLREMLATNQAVTPELQNVLVERAKTRAQCEADMLKHFQEVSRAMPPEQGRRYLAWVQEQTVLRAQPMEARHKMTDDAPAAVHHH